jgi:GrpB-like predicted nucleotidyltransferase (UPF0157 family)
MNDFSYIANIRIKKIVGFGSDDIKAAVALKRHLEEQDKAKLQHEANKKRLAELEAKNLLEYRKRTTSSSSDSLRAGCC